MLISELLQVKAVYLPLHAYDVLKEMGFVSVRKISSKEEFKLKNNTFFESSIGDENKSLIQGLYRGVVFALLENFYSKKQIWIDYFQQKCPLSFKNEQLLQKIKLFEVLITKEYQEQLKEVDSTLIDQLVRLSQIQQINQAVSRLSENPEDEENFKFKDEGNQEYDWFESVGNKLQNIAYNLKIDIILIIFKEDKTEIKDTHCEGIFSQHYIFLMIDCKNEQVFMIYTESQILNMNDNYLELLDMPIREIKSNLHELSVQTNTRQLIQRFRETGIILDYADPVHARIKLILEARQFPHLKNDQANRLFSNPSKASVKLQKYQNSFHVKPDPTDKTQIMLYKREFVNHLNGPSLMVPKIDEELELLTKCHKEERHEGPEYSMLRDMILNNCFITNFQRKIDFIESICKSCKEIARNANKKRKFYSDTDDVEDRPGQDYYFEMVSLKKYFNSEDQTQHIVFMMDSFSRLFMGWLLEDRNVSKNKYAILSRIFQTVRTQHSSGRIILKIESMGPSMNKIFADLQINHCLGTTEIFDIRVKEMLDYMGKSLQIAKIKGKSIILKDELNELINKINCQSDKYLEMTPVEAYTLTYKVTKNLIGLTQSQIADLIREKDIGPNTKLNAQNTKLGSIAEIDPQYANKIKMKDKNTLVIYTYEKVSNDDVIIGGKVVSIYDENFIQIKYIQNIMNQAYSIRIPMFICRQTTMYKLQKKQALKILSGSQTRNGRESSNNHQQEKRGSSGQDQNYFNQQYMELRDLENNIF